MVSKTQVGWIVSAVVGLVLFMLALGSVYTVDEGERGVVVRYGSVVAVNDSGLHFKWPLIESVRKISTQEHLVRYPTMEAYSNDQQPATMGVSVRYTVDTSRVDDVYRHFGDRKGLIDRQVTPKVLEEVKAIFGQFNAATAIRERSRLNADIATAVQKSITGPVIILGVQVEDVAFSGAYEDSVERRMLAEVGVERERQNLEKEKVEADIVRTRAAAEADRIRESAQAEAEAIRMRGNAEAAAIRDRAEALGQNPLLIELVKAETWDGGLPTTMLPNTAVPFIEANK